MKHILKQENLPIINKPYMVNNQEGDRAIIKDYKIITKSNLKDGKKQWKDWQGFKNSSNFIHIYSLIKDNNFNYVIIISFHLKNKPNIYYNGYFLNNKIYTT